MRSSRVEVEEEVEVEEVEVAIREWVYGQYNLIGMLWKFKLNDKGS